MWWARHGQCDGRDKTGVVTTLPMSPPHPVVATWCCRALRDRYSLSKFGKCNILHLLQPQTRGRWAVLSVWNVGRLGGAITESLCRENVVGSRKNRKKKKKHHWETQGSVKNCTNTNGRTRTNTSANELRTCVNGDRDVIEDCALSSNPFISPPFSLLDHSTAVVVQILVHSLYSFARTEVQHQSQHAIETIAQAGRRHVLFSYQQLECWRKERWGRERWSSSNWGR